MTTIANAKNLRQYKSRFSLIVEQILAFASSTNFVKELKNMSFSFKQNTRQCFVLLNILIRRGRVFLPLNFNQFNQISYDTSNTLCAVDVTYFFLCMNHALPIFFRHFSLDEAPYDYSTNFYHVIIIFRDFGT